MISATFGADFSAFTKAAEDATTKLVSFQANAGKVQSALDKMVSNFSGTKVIQDATLMSEAIDRIGGSSKLTESELAAVSAKAQDAAEKMRAMGVEVPPKIQDLANATGGLKGVLSDLGSQIVGTAAGFLSASAILGTVQGAFHAVVDEVGRSLDAWGKQELATTRLNAALKAQGTFTPQASQALQDLSSEYQRNTRYADEDVQAVEALLTQIGNVMPSQMDKALKATTDLAAGLGIDLDTAARLVGKAFVGHTETLARYGIVVSETELKVKGITAVLDSINQHFGGQAKAQVDTYTGSVDQLKNAWNDVEEQVGSYFALVLGPTAQAVAKRLEELKAGGGGGGTKFQDNRTIVDLTKQWEALAKQPDLYAQALARAKGVAPDFKTDMTDAERLTLTLQDLSVSASRLTTTQKQAALAAFAHGESVEQATKTLERYWPDIDKSSVALDNLKKQFDYNVEYTKKWQKAAADLQPFIASSQWDGTTAGLLKLGGSIEDVTTYMGDFGGETKRTAAEQKLWGDIVTLQAGQPLSELQSKMKGIGESTNTLGDEFVKAAAKGVEFGQSLTSLESKLGGLGAAVKPALSDLNATFGTIDLDFNTLESHSTAGLKRTAEVARQQYQFMRQHADAFSSDTIQKFHDIAVAADAAAGDIGARFTAAFKGSLGDLNKVFESAFEGGGGIGGAVSSLATNLTSGLLSAIPVVGPILGQFGGAIVSGFKSLFGGPSKDELDARSTFSDFQKQFGSLQQTIDGVGAAYAKVGKTGTEAQHDLQAALDATHVSAEAEASALAHINGVLDEAKNRTQTISSALGGFTQGLTISSNALASYDELNAKQMELQVQMEAIRKDGTLSQSQKDGQLGGLQSQLDDVMKQLRQVGPLYDITRIKSQESASAIASSIIGLTDANMKAGLSFTQAVAAAGPAVEALDAQLKATGFDGGETFTFLKNEVKLAKDEIAGPALNSIHGFTAGMQGLSDAGLLNQQTFAGLTAQIGGTEEALIKQGYSGQTVSVAMKDDLQKIWELEQRYGFQADDTTQALIDQGVQSGLIGEQGKSDNQKILDVLVLIGKALGADIPKDLDALGGKFKDAAKTAKDELAKIPTSIDISANVSWNIPDLPDFGGQVADAVGGASTGGYVTPYGVQHFAGGGRVLPFRSSGTDTVPAMLTPGEVVLNSAQQKSLLDGGGGATIFQINVEGSIWSERELTDIVAKRINDKLNRRRRAS